MKNDSFDKVFTKNYLKMYQLAWASDKKRPSPFLVEITRLKELFNISSEFFPLDPAKFSKGENYNNILKSSSNLVNKFFKENSQKLKIFFQEINKSRTKLKLGREWNPTLTRSVISGVFVPPPFSVFYEEKENTIIFELNKDTTQDDLILAWKNIEDIRKRMFGRIRAYFPPKKSLDNFVKITEYKVAKFKNDSAVDFADDDRKYKKRDLDIIGEIYSSEGDISNEIDIKRSNKLKVAKYRLKKTTS